MNLILLGLAALIGFIIASVLTDLRYLDRLTRLRSERDAWEETALQAQRSAGYYRDLIVKCGKSIGIDAYTDDAGEEHDEVLCAKVPELVDRLCSQRSAMMTRCVAKGAIAIVDRHELLDELKPGWGVFKVTAQMADGTEKRGACQGDGQDLWALNTFEPDVE